jgi:branched-chain amino acid transport system permease protein
MSPIMGMDPLLRAFIVVVFGGLASLGGTVLGAYIIGLIEAASVFFLGLYYTPAVLFAVMFVFMLVRPQGLFGRAR